MARKQQDQVYRCHAWHYERKVVTHRIPAASAGAAMLRLQALQQEDGHFWMNSIGSCDGTPDPTFEVWDEPISKQLLVEGDKEIAPEGATALLRRIQRQIAAYNTECGETNTTDTGVVWKMFNDYFEGITAVIGEDTPVRQSLNE